MYNEYQKERYLANCKYEETTVETIRRFFYLTQPVEEHYGKDLSEFTDGEVSNLIIKIANKSRKTLQIACIYFEDYYNWCLEEGLITDPVNKFQPILISHVIQQAVPDEVIEEKYFDKSKFLMYIDNLTDVSNKLISYAIYNGLVDEEIINLKMSDLNIASKTLKLITGRTIEIDDLFIKLMSATNDAEVYNMHGGYIQDDKLLYYRYVVGSQFVIKPLQRASNSSDGRITKVMFRGRMQLIKKQSQNKHFSVNTIYKNGMINYVIESFKKAGYDIDLETILFEKLTGKFYKYDEQTQQYINEFGSLMSVAALRKELKGYTHCFQ